MTTTADIAAAVVVELNATAFSRPFTATRSYLPIFELGEMAELHVTILSAGRASVPLSRGQHQIDHRIEIAVQQKLGAESTNRCDPLLALVGEISAHLARRRLPAAPGAVWLRTEHAPFIDPDHLNELRQFTSLIVVTYRTWEP